MEVEEIKVWLVVDCLSFCSDKQLYLGGDVWGQVRNCPWIRRVLGLLC